VGKWGVGESKGKMGEASFFLVQRENRVEKKYI